MMLIIVLLTTLISLAFAPISLVESSSTKKTTTCPKIATSPTTTKLPKTTTCPQDISKKHQHARELFVLWQTIGIIRASLFVFTALLNIKISPIRSRCCGDRSRINATGNVWRNAKLQMLLKKLEKNYEDLGMHAIHEDMVDAWHQIMKDHTAAPISSTMKNLQIFVEKVVADYSHGIKECIYDDWEDAWNHYVIAFGKKYITKEKEVRKAIFKKNMENVQKHNVQYDLTKVSYSIKLNHFSDRTPEELKKMKDFRRRVFARHQHPMLISNEIERYQYNHSSKVPDSFDWRSKGYVTPVKFQGDCCSCYAYAGLGALEASHMKKTGNLVRLSVQNILDCTWDLGNDGCDGGSIHTVFKYAQTKGIESDDLYPYTMNASHNCRWKKEYVTATTRSFLGITKGNEVALQHAVANYGPVAVGIGTTDDFFSYGHGVFHPSRCGSADHSVLVVGYGISPVQGDYWIVKNSFGKWWGEDGYIRIARNRGNVCDVASHAIFPV